MSDPLVDVVYVRNWARGKLQGALDPGLSETILAAGAWFERAVGRSFLKRTYTTLLDGSRSSGTVGAVLYLPREHTPVIHSGAELVTVTENGQARTVALGYSTTADVIVVGANERKRCKLLRSPRSYPSLVGEAFEAAVGYWAPGYQNIAVTYKAGYSEAEIPDDVKLAVAEITTKMYMEPVKVSKSSSARGGAAVSFLDELSAQTRETIARWKAGA